jgi:hypothetical protein
MGEQALLIEVDPWARWRDAVDGKKLDLGERGKPPVGYFRRKAGQGRWEAIAIWPLGDSLTCSRTIYGNGAKMTVEEIDDLFQEPNTFAIPYEVYVSVESGEEWPVEYTTSFTTKDIKAGTVWTLEWSRERLEQQAVSKVADLANHVLTPGIGHNGAPEDLPADQVLAQKLKAKGQEFGKVLESWGGKPRTQAEAEKVGIYVNLFADCANEATNAHKIEKEPFLKAGREVDARWFGPVRDVATAYKDKAKKIGDAFKKEQDAIKKAEIDRINAEARKLAEQEAKIEGAPAAPVEEVQFTPTVIASQRGRKAPAKVWEVTDLKAFIGYLLEMETPPPDLVDACNVIARKLGAAGVKAPGIELREKS